MKLKIGRFFSSFFNSPSRYKKSLKKGEILDPHYLVDKMLPSRATYPAFLEGSFL